MVTLAAVPDPSDLEPEISLDDLKALSDDEVSDSVLMWAGRVAAGQARLLAFLGEFDAREQWSGFPSCAAWLSWRLAIGLKAANEKVRVARALRVLPLTRALFERGELSYTQVRAVTRVARPDSETEMVDIARSCSGEQIERLARGLRRAKALDDPEAQAAARHGVTVRHDDDGTVVITARLPVEQAAVVLAALETCRDQLERAAKATSDDDSAADAPAPESSAEARRLPAIPIMEPPSAAASRQQALLQIAQDWLAHQPDNVRRRAKPRLTAQLDPLSGWARLHDGELLPPELACKLSWTRFDLGRRRREADLPLRQFLGAVDGERCRFPGCRHTRHLKAHHVWWWSHGGPTDLANLVLLCHQHHQLIHDGQFAMTLHPDRTLTVRDAEGTVLPHRPALPMASAEELDPAGNVTPETCPNPWAVDRLHLAYAVSVLVHLAA